MNEIMDPIDELNARLAQMEAAQTHRAVVEQVAAAESAFRGSNPDYDDAVAHIKKVEAAKYVALGMDENSALQMINQDVAQAARALLSQGKNPAEYVYKIAKATGFTAKEVREELDQVKPDLTALAGADDDEFEKEWAKMSGADKKAEVEDDSWTKLNSRKLVHDEGAQAIVAKHAEDVDNMSDSDLDQMWEQMKKSNPRGSWR